MTFFTWLKELFVKQDNISALVGQVDLINKGMDKTTKIVQKQVMKHDKLDASLTETTDRLVAQIELEKSEYEVKLEKLAKEEARVTELSDTNTARNNFMKQYLNPLAPVATVDNAEVEVVNEASVLVTEKESK